MKKIKVMELGDSKNKEDSVTLWDKNHLNPIILEYNYEEIEKMLNKESHD